MCDQARKSHALPFSPVDEVFRDPWNRSFAGSRRGLHQVIPEGASHFRPPELELNPLDCVQEMQGGGEGVRLQEGLFKSEPCSCLHLLN